VAEISATVLVRLDLRREARAAVQQALSLAPNNPAADKHELAEVHLLLALLAQADRHYSEATREADLAIALNQEGLPAESPQGWDGYAYLGRIYLKADQPAQALQPLKHAARLLATSRPMDRADNALALARALWQTGGDRKEAQRLVDEARAIYREHPKREQEVMDLVEWFRTNAPGVYGVATTER
jgi:tetratricopeptide (TPR) repeat protein